MAQIRFDLSAIPIFAMVIWILLHGCSLSPPDPKQKTQEPNSPIETQNHVPEANAGESFSVLITEATSVEIDGSISSDPDSDPLKYTWKVMGEKVSLTEQQIHSASFTVNLPAFGDYYFVLYVDDGNAISEPSFLTITVLPPDGWVDDDFSEENTEDNQFTTISSAIKKLGPHKLIAVMPGIYEENVEVAEGVHLYGVVSPSGEWPEVSASVADIEDMRAVVTLNAESILENMVVSCTTSPSTELFLSIVKANSITSSAFIQNCRVETSIGFQNHYVDGVSIAEDAVLSIGQGSKIEHISGEGIFAQVDSELAIENTRIGHAGGSSVWSDRSRQVSLKNCVIHHSGSDGLDLTSRSVEIDHCTIAYFNRSGIKLNGTSEWQLKNTLTYAGETGANIYEGDILIDQNPFEETILPNSNTGNNFDPEFKDPRNCNFQLQPTSPAVDMGENDADVGAKGDVLRPLQN